MGKMKGSYSIHMIAVVCLMTVPMMVLAEVNLSLNQENRRQDSSLSLKSADDLSRTEERKSERKGAAGRSTKPLNQWDKNGNGLLEPSEREAMIADFYARYDKNGDGIIDEYEKALILKDLELAEQAPGLSLDDSGREKDSQ